MQKANIHLPEAVVTVVCEFRSNLGYGARFNVEASSGTGSVFFEVVTYDNEARGYCKYIHEGDSVEVTGFLKAKPYRKKDGTTGISLVIERPESFRKVASSNSNSQLTQDSSDSETKNPSQEIEEVTASEGTATAVTDFAVTAPAETTESLDNDYDPEFGPPNLGKDSGKGMILY